MAERSALLDASGNFQFTLPNQGTYSVVAQGRHWLGKKLTPVTVGAAGASGLNFILVNGDIDGDNEVGIGDYSQLSEAYLSTYLAPTWNEDADLNGDEEVDIGDYSVLAANYGILGD